MTCTTRTVEGPGATLATRDYGGHGPPLLLLHGAGMDQGSLQPLAGHLRSAFRVISFDLRGHGGSCRVPWTVASSVQDVSAVAQAYELGVPAVAGHSLGGMVAVAYGLEHPSCPGVVNIDGHGRGRPDQYPGYDEAAVRLGWQRQDRRVDQLTSGLPGVTLRWLLMAARKPVVTAETVRQVTRAVAALDLFEMYRQLPCPLLVFNATATEERRRMKLWAGEGLALSAAFRRGLERDLAALAAERPQTEVVTLDASHMLIRSHPDVVARHITTFLRSRLPRVQA